MSHTILLEQPEGKKSRTYRDFNSVNKCCESLINLYESKLRKLNPNVKRLQYDVSNVHQFLDTYEDLAALVFQDSTNTYVPHDKKWLKQQIFNIIKRRAN